MKHFRNCQLIFLLVIALLLGACNGGNEADKPEQTPGEDGDQVTEQKGEIVIGRNNWAENIAVANMWKVLLEEKGYDVEIQAMDKAPVWLGISKGELDIAPEIWLPNTDASLMERFENDVEMHDVWYEKTGLGLVVPTYMKDINSIEDLNAKKDKIDGRIVGIDPGASLTEMTENAIKEYDLDLQLVTSSDPAMMAELSTHYDNEKPIVVTLWSPHWAFSKYDLKYLEDPKKVYGEADDIYYMTRTGFKDDHPEIIEWMNKWKMDDASLGSLMAVINEVGDPLEGATNWIEDNRELVQKWIE